MKIQPDDRSPERKALDEQIAAEFEQRFVPEPQPGITPRPLEDWLRDEQRPTAIAGIVEKGVVRPIDRDVVLPERARVIIVSPGT